MEFREFKEKFQKNFEKLTENVSVLFVVDTDKDEIWETYLDGFPEGTNEILRERREFDCSACRQFIKAFGNVVVLKNNKLTSIWDFEVEDPKYQAVIDALDLYVKSKDVVDVFITRESKIGTDKNHEMSEDGTVITWHHFFLELPQRFIDRSRKTIDTVKGNYRSVKDVFKRSLDEIDTEAVETVLELIDQNSLYKGEEWKGPLTEFLKYKNKYDALSAGEHNNYAWENSVKAGPVIGKIRNHSIGTLLIDISADMDLDTAVKRYEKIVAPTNYKRPKDIFTKRMLEDAKKTVTELGYGESLLRRSATIDDITVNNILFVNRDSAKRMGNDVFEELETEIALDPKKFSRVEEIPVDRFIKDVLPTAKEVEVMLENKHISNMVSLIAPQNKNAPSMFKWNNSFGWAYTGNITDSFMKERVKSAGGNVEGDLRFSIQWNDGNNWNKNDLDAHCGEPNGNVIYFPKKGQIQPSSGMLDVDIIDPMEGKPAVENITYTDKSRMPQGTYKFYVHCYSYRGGKDGFRAEVEFDGQIFEFDYPKNIRQGEKVQVAEVTWDGYKFTIKEMIPSSVSTRDVWGLKTNQFIPVSIVMYSPNYWDEQKGNGHRHVFFMLKDCVNPEKPNGFYNEFLKQELLEHKRVFEALGSKMSVEDVEDQLSGVGFSTTKRGEILVKVIGQTERVLKVKF